MIGSAITKVRAGVVANTVRQSVTRAGREVILSRQQFRIFLFVARAKYGVTPERLFDLIYSDCIDGGPLTGRKAVHVQRINLNKKLAPLGLAIKGGGSGHADGVYELVPLRPREVAA